MVQTGNVFNCVYSLPAVAFGAAEKPSSKCRAFPEGRPLLRRTVLRGAIRATATR
jgi:hypothetical protein